MKPLATFSLYELYGYQAGRTTFCHLFFINPYVIGTQKLPVASPKNMYNL